jgi:hypothetical protein
LVFVQAIATDVFEVLTDERRASSHDNRTQPNALNQVLTLVWGKGGTKKITRHLLDSEVLYAHERVSGGREGSVGGGSLAVLSSPDSLTVYGSLLAHCVCESTVIH